MPAARIQKQHSFNVHRLKMTIQTQFGVSGCMIIGNSELRQERVPDAAEKQKHDERTQFGVSGCKIIGNGEFHEEQSCVLLQRLIIFATAKNRLLPVPVGALCSGGIAIQRIPIMVPDLP